MIASSFDSGWSVRPKASPFAVVAGGAAAWTPVTLPHDALIGTARSAESAQGVNAGYFPGGAFEYEKRFEVPEQWRRRRATLAFDGVYRDAMVFVNDDLAGHWAHGYSPFTVELDPYLRYGAQNVVRVEARAHQDSRWYTGAGIHRSVRLLVGELVHVPPNGVLVTTPDVSHGHAIVVVATRIRNADASTVTARLRTTLHPGTGTEPDGAALAAEEVPVTVLAGEEVVVRQRLRVEHPALWGVDTPNLHTVQTTLLLDGAVLEQTATSFGIRSLRLDAVQGLRVNDVPVKLRGACIHHDNGLLGAAALPRAEERRVELLKAAGFNAIRSAHNPVSPALLDACDRLGMFVMDEAFDVWTVSKTDHDYSIDFPSWWRRDLAAMVEKDRNHPSVILYSIGNEPFEAGSAIGASWGRRLADAVRADDPTRFVTNGINAAIAVLAHTQQIVAELASAGQGSPGSQGGDVNTMLGTGPEIFNAISASPLVSERVEESCSVLDVVGLNYGDSRYELEAEQHPQWVLVGSETFPTHIARNWPRVLRLPNVIGDFTWTGWDYLGESGIGRPRYPEDGDGVQGPFPWLAAWCGDLDLTGVRRPASYLRQIVFGLRAEPYLAVRRPERFGHPVGPNGWGWSDSLSSWTWDVPAGSPIEIEVYSDADQVELLVDGRSVGTAPAGPGHGFTATFTTTYQPGTLQAVAFTGGTERARTRLVTAGPQVRLHLVPDRTQLRPDPDDACFVSLELRDLAGVLHPATDRAVTVTVEGPAVLQGLGSADPRTLEPFTGATCTTYQGRACAILRPTGEPGRVVVTASAAGLDPVVGAVDVGPAGFNVLLGRGGPQPPPPRR